MDQTITKFSNTQVAIINADGSGTISLIQTLQDQVTGLQAELTAVSKPIQDKIDAIQAIITQATIVLPVEQVSAQVAVADATLSTDQPSQ